MLRPTRGNDLYAGASGLVVLRARPVLLQEGNPGFREPRWTSYPAPGGPWQVLVSRNISAKRGEVERYSCPGNLSLLVEVSNEAPGGSHNLPLLSEMVVARRKEGG